MTTGASARNATTWWPMTSRRLVTYASSATITAPTLAVTTPSSSVLTIAALVELYSNSVNVKFASVRLSRRQRLRPRARERRLRQDGVRQEDRARHHREHGRERGIAPEPERDRAALPALAADARVSATPEQALLHEEQQRGREQQRDRDRRRQLHLRRELEERPHLRGDRVEAGGQREDRRRAEQRERLEHGQDEAAHDRGRHERQRDRQRHAEAAGAVNGRGVLQIGGDQRERVRRA